MSVNSLPSNGIPDDLLREMKAALREADSREPESEKTPPGIRAAELREVFGQELGAATVTAEDVIRWRSEPADARAADCGMFASEQPYHGIGGWLFFFIIVHMYLRPAFSILSIVLGLAVLDGFVEEIIATESLFLLVMIAGMIEFATLAWGILAAWRLQTLKPRAVQFVKIYILANAALGTIGVMLEAATGNATVFNLVGVVLAATIWYSYFTVSKRVNATYPDAGEPVMLSAV